METATCPFRHQNLPHSLFVAHAVRPGIAAPKLNGGRPLRQGKLFRRTWLGEYEENTPGTEVLANPTTMLSTQGAPEPDGCLLILPECGGQTREDAEEFIVGAPELIAEIAWSTESIDLNQKKTDYEKAGVREYVVVALRMQRVFWFVRRHGKFKEQAPGGDGIYRSEIFPGLWLDSAALLRRDMRRVLAAMS
jgi:Uma2 family endonuclease